MRAENNKRCEFLGISEYNTRRELILTKMWIYVDTVMEIKFM